MIAAAIIVATELVIDRSNVRPPMCTGGRSMILWIANWCIGSMAGCCAILALILVIIVGHAGRRPKLVQPTLTCLRRGTDRDKDREPRADQPTANHAPGLSSGELIQEP